MERLGNSARSEGAAPHPVGDAEALAAALERIVFLECRLEQQSSAAAAERDSARRAREALAAAATREAAELRRQGELEAAIATARAENAELVRRLGVAEAGRAAAEAARHGQGEGLARDLSAARAALETERRTGAAQARALSDAHARIADLEAAREHLFARLVAWQRACDGTRESFDLAEFIAELRREIVALEQARDEGRAREHALRLALDRAGVEAAAVVPERADAAGGATRAAPGVSTVSAVSAVSAVAAPVAGGNGRATGGAERAGGSVGSPGASDASELPAMVGSSSADVSDVSAGAGSVPAGSFTSALAARFAAEGRLGVSAAEIEESFAELKPAEARLARRLAAEVAGGPGGLRLRAAARLVEVAGRRATTALATAAGAEPDPALRAALVEQLGRAGEPLALPRIARFLGDDAPDVRAAAVEACVRLAEGAEARGALRRGLADPEPKVRRRAALAAAAARGVDPGPMLAPLLLDPDRQVRRLAAAALGGTRDPGAALALFSALLDPEPTVRETAADAATRLFGGDVRLLVGLPPLQRGRAVARLRAHVTSNLARLAPDGQLSPLEVPVASFAEPEREEPLALEPEPETPAAGADAGPVETPVAADAVATGTDSAETQVSADAAPAETPVSADTASAEMQVSAEAAPAETHVSAEADVAETPVVVPPVSAPPAAPGISLEAIAGVLRASLRGGTLELLGRELRCDEATLAPIVDHYLAAGDLVRRGKKLFLP